MAFYSRIFLLTPLLHYAHGAGDFSPPLADFSPGEANTPGDRGGKPPPKMDEKTMQEMMKDPAKVQEMMKMMGGGERATGMMPPGMGGPGGGMMPPGMGGPGGGMGGPGGMPGMGGMGGMGGPGGGAPPKPPPTKQIGIKTARKFMKEVISTLSAEKAKKELDEASVDKSDPQKLFQKIGPIVEKFVGGLTEKYKFEAGFGQAMQSVHDAQKRKDDSAVKAMLDTFQNIIGMAKPREGEKDSMGRGAPTEENAPEKLEEGETKVEL